MGKILKFLLAFITVFNLIIGLFLIFTSGYFIVTLGLVEKIQLSSYLVIFTFILLGIGTYIILYSSLVFHGLRKRNSRYLKTFSALIILFLILQIGAVSLATLFKYWTIEKIDEMMADAVIDDAEYKNTNYIRYMDLIQYSLNCCGRYSYREYSVNIQELPKSCCSRFDACNKVNFNETFTEWDTGCMDPLKSTFNPTIICLIALVFVVEVLMALLGWLIKFNFISIGKFIHQNARGMNTMMSMH